MSEGLSVESIKRLRELAISGPITKEDFLMICVKTDLLSPSCFSLVEWVDFWDAASAYNEEKTEPIDPRKQTKKFYMDMDRKYKVKRR